MAKVTVSVIKADIGSWVGHVAVHPELIEEAKKCLGRASGILVDYHVTACGDDLNLVMTHRLGLDNPSVHELAWNTFMECTATAKKLKLYGAGQDMLADAFSGNVRGLGPGAAEIEFDERPSEPIVIFMADKSALGAWNLPLFKIFGDPFNTAGLVIDPKMHDGFVFEVEDLYEGTRIRFNLPEDYYDILVFLGATSRFVPRSVSTRAGEPAAVASTQRLNAIAGRYVGKDDPVLIVRAHSGLPAVGEILEPFSRPHIVAGWMRGSHHGPLMPCSLETAHPTRFDGPPRVVALGFQVSDGTLLGPVDLFADPAFDKARQEALEIADMLRRHGPFEPHRLPLEEMEYTTMPGVMERLKERFKVAD